MKHKQKGRVPSFAWTDRKLLQEFGFRTSALSSLEDSHLLLNALQVSKSADSSQECVSELPAVFQTPVNPQVVPFVPTKGKGGPVAYTNKARTLLMDHAQLEEFFKPVRIRLYNSRAFWIFSCSTSFFSA